ncbi:hypothetical protein GGC65_002394 [Sphingopyxis sp. OAS728]|uniref:lasso peptide biosynthesis B2 protein n=1 Tax=Sphingopyxis sp. OAS728 TaxID=2663823 RepID=UPI00178A2AAD|nr:lasso peptide biosynthesis B2 protein [Sphingopyxis sp. OAS728]MBE1527938.1 hypothetical protein [Sphingopyxis sp. OAS728]
MRRAAIDRLHADLSQAMTAYRLRTSLRYCAIGARFVFLDIAGSRYFLLEGGAAGYFAEFLAGDRKSDAMLWLIERGLIETGEPIPPRRLPTAANASLFEETLPAPSLALVAEALAQQVIARRRVRREPLSALLAPLHAGKPDIELCVPLAAAFSRAARYANAEDQCLAHGIAMRAMLARRGLASELVIGVRLPFAAHCWVQLGETVLSDPLDRVQNFRPIVAVS